LAERQKVRRQNAKFLAACFCLISDHPDDEDDGAGIPNAELEFKTALQPLVREIFQTQAHFINFALNGFANTRRQVIERF